MTEIPQDEQQMPVVPITTPSAQTLADLTAVHRDLGFVTSCCDRLIRHMDGAIEGQMDATLCDALWSAAVIAYARCFGGGKRTGLQTSDVEGLPGLEGEVLEFHQFVLNLRNKHVAHSVNPFERTSVGAVLSPPKSVDRKVEGIALLAMRYLSPDRQGIWQLGGLATALAQRIRLRAEELMRTVQAEAESINVATLYELTPLRHTAPGAEDSGTSRQR